MSLADESRLARTRSARELAERGRAADGHGEASQALLLFDEAIGLLEAEPPNQLLAELLRWKGTTLRDRGETFRAEQLYERSLEVALAADARGARAHALNCLAAIALRRGNLDRASGLLSEAARDAAQVADKELFGLVSQNRGVVASMRGHQEEALARYAESLRGFEGSGNAHARVRVYNNIGVLHLEGGRTDEAREALDRGLELARRQEDRCAVANIQGVRARLALLLGDVDGADSLLVEMFSIAAEREDRSLAAEAFRVRGLIELRRAKLDEANESLERARQLAEGTDDAHLVAETLRELGEVAHARGEPDRARSVLKQSRESFHNLGAQAAADHLAARLSLMR